MAEPLLAHCASEADLSTANTLALPARAAWCLQLQTLAQLAPVCAAARAAGLPWLVLGGGSNLVLPERFPGLVLKVELRGRRLLASADDHWLVEFAAGENWHEAVMWTLAQGWPGLENLALVPGTVGAAPVQNIGAYGLELAERFDSLEAIELATGERRRFYREDCGFAYRDSIFRRQPGRWLICSVRLRLPRPWQARLDYAELAGAFAGHVPDAAALAAAVIEIRRRKLPDPAQLPNAGSFFKNPLVGAVQAEQLCARHPGLPAHPQADGRVKLAAGWLIEQAGWKGQRLGPVGCHRAQALVVVNHGGATRADVQRLAEALCADVAGRFGVTLETEPVFP